MRASCMIMHHLSYGRTSIQYCSQRGNGYNMMIEHKGQQWEWGGNGGILKWPLQYSFACELFICLRLLFILYCAAPSSDYSFAAGRRLLTSRS